VVNGPDHDPARGGLLLEMALKTENRIALGEHLLIDRTMGMMTGGASLAQGLVLEDMGTALGLVTSDTGVVPGQKGRGAADRGIPPVRFVAGAASEARLKDRVMIGESKLAANVGMAQKATLRVPIGVNQRSRRPATLHMDAGRAVA
jgi:hypothetical protein